MIDIFCERQLNPNNYILRSHNELLVYNSYILDMKTENAEKKILIPDDCLLLEQGKLYLGRTKEHTKGKYQNNFNIQTYLLFKDFIND
ncbi:MAG: hypothetical protein ABIJ97_10780 [Bacteroidota bacterium]